MASIRLCSELVLAINESAKESWSFNLDTNKRASANNFSKLIFMPDKKQQHFIEQQQKWYQIFI